jgi:hypothetical protein
MAGPVLRKALEARVVNRSLCRKLVVRAHTLAMQALLMLACGLALLGCGSGRQAPTPASGETMQLILMLRQDVAQSLHGRRPATDSSRALEQAVKELGGTLRAQHPESQDAALEVIFVVDNLPSAAATRAIERLQRQDGVESAYLKPAESPPYRDG